MLLQLWTVLFSHKQVLLTQTSGFYVKMTTVTTFLFALSANTTLLNKSEISLKPFYLQHSTNSVFPKKAVVECFNWIIDSIGYFYLQLFAICSYCSIVYGGI